MIAPHATVADELEANAHASPVGDVEDACRNVPSVPMGRFDSRPPAFDWTSPAPRLAIVVAPFAPTENKLFPTEFCTWNMFAICPKNPPRVSAVEFVEVERTLTTEFAIGVVVPNDDCPVPLTAPAIWEKAAAVMSCRGESVWNVTLSGETSTCR